MVTGLSYKVDRMDISILFNGFDIQYLYLDKGYGTKNKFATVQLKDKKDAENAIQMLNKTKYKGNEIKVKWTIGKTIKIIIILKSSSFKYAAFKLHFEKKHLKPF